MLAWIIMGRDSITTLMSVEPKYVLLGGIIGAGITWTVIKSMELLGPAKATLAIVITQLLASYLIELFGLFGVEKEPFVWRKVIGLGVAFIGILIFQWRLD
jgi:transporter family-2 protein